MKKTDITFFFLSSAVIMIALLSGIKQAAQLEIVQIRLDSIQEIIPVEDSLVIPVLYDTLLIDRMATVSERKKQFIDQVLPAILIVRFQMENKGKHIERLINKIERNEALNDKESRFADSLMTRFRADSYENLLVRLKPHPTSLVLAQAAVESGWGQSRFAIEGNNLFGVWTSSCDKNVIKSRYDRDDQQIFLKRYNNVAESIDHYFLTIGRHNAYRKFRQERFKEADVIQLIEALDRYSENGEVYTLLLKKVIDWNQLEKYDNYSIDPEYITSQTLLNYYFEKVIQYGHAFIEKDTTNFICNEVVTEN
ncbi:glucosaminidase domain-containing protein [Roseimarinus sediminis]|uniref:glucosaminidase domain-containing protein n=1 Tax=Roseimarinus sediminis TaxID=1610899 RepID=UPI003D23B5DA